LSSGALDPTWLITRIGDAHFTPRKAYGKAVFGILHHEMLPVVLELAARLLQPAAVQKNGGTNRWPQCDRYSTIFAMS
jgi:hypothetical protein